MERRVQGGAGAASAPSSKMRWQLGFEGAVGWSRVPRRCDAVFKKARAQGNLGVRVVEGAARFPARLGRALRAGEGRERGRG